MKRLISWLLALTLIIACLPLSALSVFAAENDIANPDASWDLDEEFSDLLETTAPEETEPAEGTYENPFKLIEGRNVLVVTPGTSFYAEFPSDGKNYEIEVYSVAAYQVAYGRGYQIAEGDSTTTMELNAEAAQYFGYVVTFDSFGEEVTAIYVNLSEKVAVPGSESNPIELTVSKDAPASATANVTTMGGNVFYAVTFAEDGYVKFGGETASFSVGYDSLEGGDAYQVTAGTYTVVVGEISYKVAEVPFTITYMTDEELAAIAAAEAVMEQIDALVDLEWDEDLNMSWVLKDGITYVQVEAARAAYDALTEEGKAYAADKLSKLTTAEDLIANCDAHDDATVAKGAQCKICGKLKLTGITATFGDSLAMNFVLAFGKLAGTDNVAVLTKEYADGSTVEIRVPQKDWVKYGTSTTLKYIAFPGVAAKEMTDNITCVVENAAGEQVTITYVTSLRDYAVAAWNAEYAKTSPDNDKLTQYIDMLNYGAAAQEYFDNYHSDDLANSTLTDLQKSYATSDEDIIEESLRLKGDGMAGCTMDVKSSVALNFVYQNSMLNKASYAKATYTNHYGNKKEFIITEFKQYGTSTTLSYIPVSGMTAADYGQLITLELYDANDNVISTSQDSIAGCCWLATSSNNLYWNLLKYCRASYYYFH